MWSLCSRFSSFLRLFWVFCCFVFPCCLFAFLVLIIWSCFSSFCGCFLSTWGRSVSPFSCFAFVCFVCGRLVFPFLLHLLHVVTCGRFESPRSRFMSRGIVLHLVWLFCFSLKPFCIAGGRFARLFWTTLQFSLHLLVVWLTFPTGNVEPGPASSRQFLLFRLFDFFRPYELYSLQHRQVNNLS